jgi:hypothetical protein
MRINYGGKEVKYTEVPIGLRWAPKDKRTPLNLFAYAGMMVPVHLLFTLPFPDDCGRLVIGRTASSLATRLT